MRVGLGDCPLDSAARLRVDQHGKAPGHRIAGHAALAPALDIAGNIGGAKGRSVVPRHAFAHVQSIVCRILGYMPIFQQLREVRSLRVALERQGQPSVFEYEVN